MTQLVVPLNTRALPKRPAVVHAVPVVLPAFPLPERSPTSEPLPSLKP